MVSSVFDYSSAALSRYPVENLALREGVYHIIYTWQWTFWSQVFFGPFSLAAPWQHGKQ
jgi:hypothetical protein